MHFVLINQQMETEKEKKEKAVTPLFFFYIYNKQPIC